MPRARRGAVVESCNTRQTAGAVGATTVRRSVSGPVRRPPSCAARTNGCRPKCAARTSARRCSLARSCRTLLITLIVAGKSRQSWRANNHNQGMLCRHAHTHAHTHARTHTRTVLRYVRGSVAWTTWYAALCPTQELHTRAKAAEAQLESVRTLVATRGDRHMRHAAMRNRCPETTRRFGAHGTQAGPLRCS